MYLTNPNMSSIIEARDRSDSPPVVEITPAMVAAGLYAFREELGYQHSGDAEEAIKAIYLAMAMARAAIIS